MTDLDHPDGVYRVVGTDDGTVTLLRVADADGQRVNSGEIVTVRSDELAECPEAKNPDGNRPLGEKVTSNLMMTFWSLRAFAQQLVVHPIPSVLAVALVAIGVVGEEFVQLPSAAQSALILGGSLGLAYIGSGRL
ncbi:hypothetical protein ACFQDG_04520 [Natronoarchaeum mannanilyticum]|uniref:hypothetical protein n=1 Tax=Natronoarchaeum mannanilyticum TaxID=926360 RepID=UPI0031DEE884